MASPSAIKRLFASAAVLCALAAVSHLVRPGTAAAGFAYKSYIVRQEGGHDILCDPYVVQKNDWVLKIFKLRGEIAQADFPRFLRLFRRINPHIHDINTIRPGQHILIPLKEISGGSLAREPSGIVQVPFLALSKSGPTPAAEPQSAGAYQVRSGDCVSRLVASRFGDYGTQAYRRGLEAFRSANPGIRDLSRIYVGQWIQLPGLADSGAGAMAAQAGAVRSQKAREVFAPVRTGYDLYESLREQEPDESGPDAALKEAASLLEARLLDKGVFYFPQTAGGEDLPMDMADVPVMTLPDGRRILFHAPDRDVTALLDAVRKHWHGADAVALPPGADAFAVLDAVGKIVRGAKDKGRVELTAEGLHLRIRARWILDLTPSADGIAGHLCITVVDDPSQKTPSPLVRFLADRQVIIRDVVRPDSDASGEKASRPAPAPPPMPPVTVAPDAPRTFVRNLCKAMGYSYAPNVTITFPYAGIQVAAVSNLVTTPQGTPLFVDFEDLYGDAVKAIEESGFRIVQIPRLENAAEIVKKLLTAMDVDVAENPEILAASRPAGQNVTVEIPGFLVRSDTTDDLLLTDLILDPAIREFLREKGIRPIVFAPHGQPSEPASAVRKANPEPTPPNT